MALDLITTAAGRAAILRALEAAQTITVQDVQLSATVQPVSEATTELNAPIVTLPVSGSVRSTSSGPVLHIAVTDDGPLAYDLHALALRVEGGTLLLAYSQSEPIARKAAQSALTLALDLSIDDQTAATVTFGDTDFALPPASADRPGVVRLADWEAVTTFDETSAVTPNLLGGALGCGATHRIWVPPYNIGPGSALQLGHETNSLAVQRGSMQSEAELRWSLPPVPRNSTLNWVSTLRIRRAWPPGVSFKLTAHLNVVRVSPDQFNPILRIDKETASSFPFEGGGLPRFGEVDINIAWPESGPRLLAVGVDHVALELILRFFDASFPADRGPDTNLISIIGYWLTYEGPRTVPFVY